MLELIVFKNSICVVVYSPDYGWVLHRSLCIDRGIHECSDLPRVI
jgi:hypothetical protein